MSGIVRPLRVAVLGLFVTLPWSCGAAPANPPVQAKAGDSARGDVIANALRAELERTMSALRLEDYERPYFVGFRLVDRTSIQVSGRFGAVSASEEDRGRTVAVDVRVGDYVFDSSPDSNDFSFDDAASYEPSNVAAIDDDPEALRGTLWLLADTAYKKALSSHLRKKARKVTEVEEGHVDSFSREKPTQSTAKPLRLEADRARWADIVRRVTARFRRDPRIIEGSLRFSADHQRVYVLNSEGTSVQREEVLYSVAMSAMARAPDGMLLDQGQTLYGRTPGELPDEKGLERMVDEAIANLGALAAAPVADPYTGPAILEPEATGVFFHETVGHRLEGERQKDENEGRTFKGELGKPILPEFLTVRDDPTRARWGQISLNGHYDFDDEGVPSQNVVLVERGVLRTFLTGRTPVEGAPRSNGHGRAQSTHRPVARMGNLIVESARRVPRARLKEMLVEEARKQGKPYGLIIRDITGGSTNTSNYGYQAFKGTPRMVFRVDAQTGAETLVRGVEMVGTPLTAVSRIVAASEEEGIFNGYCGAESGYVPVSTVAPATLFSEIELQRNQRDKERAPVLSPPWVPTPPARP